MLQNLFSHRSPLYDVFDKAELYVLHAPCGGVSIRLIAIHLFPDTIRRKKFHLHIISMESVGMTFNRVTQRDIS